MCRLQCGVLALLCVFAPSVLVRICAEYGAQGEQAVDVLLLLCSTLDAS